MMNIHDYGAAPLAKTFILVRGFSLVCMVGIVGMAANFVAEIVGTNVDPPHEVVGTLVMTCLAALYCLISIPFFLARANLGLLIMTGIDAALLLTFVVISVVVGRPLSFLNCGVIGNASAAANAESMSIFSQSLASNYVQAGTIALSNWAGATRSNCLETKAIWGLCIVLCILFTCSSLILPTLWFKARKASASSGKSVV